MFLDVGEDGSVEGVASARADESVGLEIVTGQVRGSHLVLQWSDLVVPPFGLLGFDELRLWLLDDDGDGAIDGARGEGTGEWGAAGGIDHSLTQHDSVLIATLDQGQTEVTINRPLRGILQIPTRDIVFPHDHLRINFGEPLREADVREHLRVVMGDDIVPGQIALEPVNGLVVRATFQPDQLLPFGAELGLDVSELNDVAGNQLSYMSNVVDVIENPGPLGDNLGFESGLTGWFTLGDASTQGTVDGFAPAEGAAQAVLGVEGTLGAVLELPADATELGLSITVLSTFDGFIPPPVSIRLHRPGGEVIDIDTTPLDDSLRECESCSFYESQNGPIRLTANLEGIAAGPVVLEVAVWRQTDIEDAQVFLIDDIQVR